MSDIYFRCECGKSLAVGLMGAGRTIVCADCGRPVAVPAPDMEFACPHCDEVHLGSSEIEGDEVACTACRGHLLVPASGAVGARRRLPGSAGVLLAVAVISALIIAADIRYRRVPDEELYRAPDMQGQSTDLIMPAGEFAETAPAETASPSTPPAPSVEPAAEWSVVSEVLAETCAGSDTPATLPEAQMVAAVSPPVSGDHPAKEIADRYRALRESCHGLTAGVYNAEFAGQLREVREEFMKYTRTHSGRDLDWNNWFRTAEHLLWLSSSREQESFEAADKLFRENLETIVAARTDDPSMNVHLVFGAMLLHLQEWRYRAPAEASARWLDEAAAIAEESKSSSVRERWAFAGGTHHLQVMFESGARARMNPRELAEFRSVRTERLLGYLNDGTIPLKFRTSTVWWWAAHVAGEGDAERAVNILDGWLQKHGEAVDTADFFELRMLLAFHHEGDLETARNMLERAGQLVKEGRMREDEPGWRNMTDKYFKYLLLPEYEVKRIYRRGRKGFEELSESNLQAAVK